MLSLELEWENRSIDDPTWDQVVQVIEASKKNGFNVAIYNNAAECPGVRRFILEVDEEIGVFHPALLLRPTGMRVFENINGSAELIDFNGYEIWTGVVTDDMPTVLRLAREFYETGDVREMKGRDELSFNLGSVPESDRGEKGASPFFKRNSIINKNADLFSLDTELGIFQEIHDQHGPDVLQGKDFKFAVSGKDICPSCLIDIPAAARTAGVKSVLVYEEHSGRIFFWAPGMEEELVPLRMTVEK